MGCENDIIRGAEQILWCIRVITASGVFMAFISGADILQGISHQNGRNAALFMAAPAPV